MINNIFLSGLFLHTHVNMVEILNKGPPSLTGYIKIYNFYINKKPHLPKASNIVFASRICCCTHVETSHVTEHKYWSTNFVVSVLPAPDSPDMTQDCKWE